jgi:hypothetical protein
MLIWTGGSTGSCRGTRRRTNRPDACSALSGRERNDLFRFVTRRDVPCTSNACERALRPSMIFRKVTDCFGAERGTQAYAAAASVMDTGRLHGLPALLALRVALAGVPIMQSGRSPRWG